MPAALRDGVHRRRVRREGRFEMGVSVGILDADAQDARPAEAIRELDDPHPSAAIGRACLLQPGRVLQIVALVADDAYPDPRGRAVVTRRLRSQRDPAARMDREASVGLERIGGVGAVPVVAGRPRGGVDGLPVAADLKSVGGSSAPAIAGDTAMIIATPAIATTARRRAVGAIRRRRSLAFIGDTSWGWVVTGFI